MVALACNSRRSVAVDCASLPTISRNFSSKDSNGGQKQRVLLARALYKDPKILFLDEGTAHLDVAKEREINQRLQNLSITRISVAHRPEMMSGADTILRACQGSTAPSERLDGLMV
jgi:ABC-type bacteriocin/lantibiotic exporter with double-glycine peptidase domain